VLFVWPFTSVPPHSYGAREEPRGVTKLCGDAEKKVRRAETVTPAKKQSKLLMAADKQLRRTNTS
jgi:hypothetical protein